MAIQSLQVKARLHTAIAAGVSDLTRLNPRSLEEVNELLKKIDSEVDAHKKSLMSLFNSLKKANSTSIIGDKEFAPIKSRSGDNTPRHTEEVSAKPPRALIIDDEVGLDVINKRLQEQFKKPGEKRKKKADETFQDEEIEFVKPKNFDQIKKNYDLLEGLYNKREQLDSIINIMNLNFKGQRNFSQILSHAKDIQKTINETITKTLSFLNTTAIKTEPVDLKESIEAIVDAINPVFADSYDDAEHRVYVSTTEVVNKETKIKQTCLTYTHYVKYKNFVDDDGYVHDAFFLVITGVLVLPKKGNKPILRKYVTTLQKFVMPGKFKVGERFLTPAEGVKKAMIQLDNENFSTLIERTPIPATKRDAEKLKEVLPQELIRDVEINDNIITVKFARGVNKSNKDNAIKEAFAAVASIIRGRSKAKVKYRESKDASGYTVEFILVKPDSDEIKPSRVDLPTSRKILDYIRNEVDLSEEQEQQIIQILNS